MTNLKKIHTRSHFKKFK